MAVAQGYGKTVTSGSVFAYDTGDTRNSYVGEPTTNLALFSVTSGITFNTDYAALTSQVADYNVTYRGRPSLRCTSTGQWNIYKYPRSGNYTATSSTVFTFSWKMKWSDGRVPAFSNGYIYTDAQRFYNAVSVTAIEDGWYLCQNIAGGTSSPIWLTGFTTTQYGTCYIADWQVEAKSHATSFTPAGTTRSATQGLLPLVGNSTIDLSNVSFDSNAQMIFDGTNDYISITPFNPNFSAGLTMECVAKWTSSPGGSWQRMFDFGNGASVDNLLFCRYGSTDQLWFGVYNGAEAQYAISNSGAILFGQYALYTATADGTNFKIYVNGQLIYSTANSTIPVTTPRANNYIGKSNWPDSYFNGEIPVAKIYNRALSAAEVKQNYLHYKTRFNLS